MKYRKLGQWQTSAIGLGAMPLSIEDHPSEEQSIEVIHRALDLGINHIDTAFAYYESGKEEQTNEKLIAKALATYTGDKSKVTVASKAGHYRNFELDGTTPTWGQEGNPRYLYETGLRSRDALQVDSIDLYYYHRPDLNTKYERSLEAIAKLASDGVIKFAGISNASIAQVDLAREIIGDKFIAVQNQFSPSVRGSLDVLEYCKGLGLAFLPWSPLGGFRNDALKAKDAPFEEVAAELGVSKQQVIIAWELAQGDQVIPIPGFRRNVTLEDTIQAVELELSAEQLTKLNAAG